MRCVCRVFASVPDSWYRAIPYSTRPRQPGKPSPPQRARARCLMHVYACYVMHASITCHVIAGKEPYFLAGRASGKTAANYTDCHGAMAVWWMSCWLWDLFIFCFFVVGWASTACSTPKRGNHAFDYDPGSDQHPREKADPKMTLHQRYQHTFHVGFCSLPHAPKTCKTPCKRSETMHLRHRTFLHTSTCTKNQFKHHLKAAKRRIQMHEHSC